MLLTIGFLHKAAFQKSEYRIRSLLSKPEVTVPLCEKHSSGWYWIVRSCKLYLYRRSIKENRTQCAERMFGVIILGHIQIWKLNSVLVQKLCQRLQRDLHIFRLGLCSCWSVFSGCTIQVMQITHVTFTRQKIKGWKM